MSQGSCLLDEAVALALQEMNALEDGAYDQAVELAGRRCELTGMAWKMYDGSQIARYREQLSTLALLQRRLTDAAIRARDEMKAVLRRSRVERQRMRGYQVSVGQALQ